MNEILNDKRKYNRNFQRKKHWQPDRAINNLVLAGVLQKTVQK